MENLNGIRQLIVRQRKELAEVFGFETRNKYEIYSNEKILLGFCAEQQRGFFGFLLRQFLGHWRSFELQFFDTQRVKVMSARHPFRWFFQELVVYDKNGELLGSLRQRFAWLRKKFDIVDEGGQVVFRMRSGFFQFWTFPFFRGDTECALVSKKWSGLLKEAFLDADNFSVEFTGELSEKEKKLVLAASVFVDLQYFENKAG